MIKTCQTPEGYQCINTDTGEILTTVIKDKREYDKTLRLLAISRLLQAYERLGMAEED